MVKDIAAALDVPLAALYAYHGRLSPTQFASMTKTERLKLRALPRLRQLTPGEKAVLKCRLLLATTKGTATATFDAEGLQGAYICDPQQLLNLLLASSDWVASGGDAGRGYTKLGVTYFGCLLYTSPSPRD